MLFLSIRHIFYEAEWIDGNQNYRKRLGLFISEFSILYLNINISW